MMERRRVSDRPHPLLEREDANLLYPFSKALADPLLGFSIRKGMWEDGMDSSVEWRAGLYYQILNTDDLSRWEHHVPLLQSLFPRAVGHLSVWILQGCFQKASVKSTPSSYLPA